MLRKLLLLWLVTMVCLFSRMGRADDPHWSAFEQTATTQTAPMDFDAFDEPTVPQSAPPLEFAAFAPVAVGIGKEVPPCPDLRPVLKFVVQSAERGVCPPCDGWKDKLIAREEKEPLPFRVETIVDPSGAATGVTKFPSFIIDGDIVRPNDIDGLIAEWSMEAIARSLAASSNERYTRPAGETIGIHLQRWHGVPHRIIRKFDEATLENLHGALHEAEKKTLSGRTTLTALRDSR